MWKYYTPRGLNNPTGGWRLPGGPDVSAGSEGSVEFSSSRKGMKHSRGGSVWKTQRDETACSPFEPDSEGMMGGVQKASGSPRVRISQPSRLRGGNSSCRQWGAHRSCLCLLYLNVDYKIRRGNRHAQERRCERCPEKKVSLLPSPPFPRSLPRRHRLISRASCLLSRPASLSEGQRRQRGGNERGPCRSGTLG